MSMRYFKCRCDILSVDAMFINVDVIFINVDARFIMSMRYIKMPIQYP